MVIVYSCTDDLTILEELGEGSYGVVYKGELTDEYGDSEEVAIKVIKQGDAIKELQRMSKLDHPNVLKLLGFVPKGSHDEYCDCVESQRALWLVLELMPFGSLLQYVRDRPGGLKAATMEKMAYQIALGMDYLHRDAGLVHRDLAARNILVGDGNNVKIADFGLCDEYFEDQYYYGTHGKPCPIRWMPPENLPDSPPFMSYGSFSRKGDVWSFAVVLYEIWSRGKTPLYNLDDLEVISEVKSGTTVLNAGGTLHARGWVIELIGMCLEFDKADRPNFRKIYKFIDESSEYNLY